MKVVYTNKYYDVHQAQKVKEFKLHLDNMLKAFSLVSSTTHDHEASKQLKDFFYLVSTEFGQIQKIIEQIVDKIHYRTFAQLIKENRKKLMPEYHEVIEILEKMITERVKYLSVVKKSSYTGYIEGITSIKAYNE